MTRRRLTRRQTLGLLGAGAGLGCLAGSGQDAGAATQAQTPAPRGDSPAFPPGAVIRTLLADLAPAALAGGATLFHEHLTVGGDVDFAVEEVKMAGFDGVTCLVDATTGRRTPETVEKVRQIAQRSGVHIVMAGGYLEDMGFSPYPPHIATMSEDDLVAEFLQDAKAHRWGAFGEIGTSLQMQPDERKMLRAVSKANLRTGLPIFTHNPHESCPSCARGQLDIFESQGVDPKRVCIGHLSTIKPSDDPTMETHKGLARRGAFLGFDTIGHQMARSSIPEADKVKMVIQMLDAGFEDHLLFSSDMGNRDHLKHYWGNGYSTVLMQFVPKLRYAKVPERTIQKILVDNPRRFLAFVPKAT